MDRRAALGAGLGVRTPTESHFRVVRFSVGVKLGQGPWSFSRDDRLDGVLLTHPVNASRKVVIATEQGTFSLNEEDLEEL